MEVDELFRVRWPRLYLDTAILNDIGRGNAEHNFVSDLLDVLRSRCAVLVISEAHMRDALKPGDLDAPGLLATTLERFWMRGLVMRGPHEIEPWKNGPNDIEIEPWGNVRELLTSDVVAPALAIQNVLQQFAHDSDLALKAEQRSLRAAEPKQSRLSNADAAILQGSVNVLVIGLRHEVGAAIDYCASSIDCVLTSAERAELIARLQPALAGLKAVAPVMDLLAPEERLDLWPGLKAGPEIAPGKWLARQLMAERVRNADRKPKPSDIIDAEHAVHFPYVDIATCDKEAFPVLSRNLGRATGSRSCKLFRNGDVAEMLAYLQALPVGE